MARRSGRRISGRSVSVSVKGAHNVTQVGSNQRAMTTATEGVGRTSDVDMASELAAIKKLLLALPARSPIDQQRVENALTEAEQELKRTNPDRDEVGVALERAISYAKRATKFSATVAALKPHIERAATWLGTNWDSLTRVLR
jgi:flagellin-like hook-associated protein FlgL